MILGSQKNSSPDFPTNILNQQIGIIMPGTITAFCGNIDLKNKTYELLNINKFIRLNFSPTFKNNTGWITCDGSSVDISVFPSLFETIGFLYGAGKEANQFRIPDFSGYFLRGLALNDTVDKGFSERQKYPVDKSTGTQNGVGSIQGNMVQKHEHKYVNLTGVTPALSNDKPATAGQNTNVFTDADIYSPSQEQLSGNETRPVNIYVNYLVYAGLPASIKQITK